MYLSVIVYNNQQLGEFFSVWNSRSYVYIITSARNIIKLIHIITLCISYCLYLFPNVYILHLYSLCNWLVVHMRTYYFILLTLMKHLLAIWFFNDYYSIYFIHLREILIIIISDFTWKVEYLKMSWSILWSCSIFF